MKTTLFNYAMKIAIPISILFATSVFYSQQNQQKITMPEFYSQSQPVNVFLTVDTKALYEASYPYDTAEYCVLNDDTPGSTPSTGNDIKLHSTPVSPSNMIIWHIQKGNLPDDAPYTLRLENIWMKMDVEGNTNIFDKDPLDPTGNIIQSKALYEGDYYYTIYFSIEYNGVIKRYRVDPDLKSNT